MQSLTEKCAQIVHELHNGYKVTTRDVYFGYYDLAYSVGDLVNAYDYLSGTYEYDFIISKRIEYRGVVVTVAQEGPTIDINTHTCEVLGYWGNEKVVLHYHRDLMDVQAWGLDMFKNTSNKKRTGRSLA